MPTRSAGGGLAAQINSNNQLIVTDDAPNTLVATPHNETGAQTDHELIAAPAAGKRLVITRLLMANGAVAGTLKCEEATAGAKTQFGPTWYLGVNANEAKEVYWRCSVATNFGFTSVTVTTHSISAEYHVESV